MTDLIEKLKRLEAAGVPLWADNQPDAESFRVYFDTPRGQYMSSCTDSIFYEEGPQWQHEWLIIGCIVKHMHSLGYFRRVSDNTVFEEYVYVLFMKRDIKGDWSAPGRTELEATIDAALAALEG